MKYFTIKELCQSSTTTQKGIDNTPNSEIVSNLEQLVDKILDPLREEFGESIIVNSGYRSPALNKAVKLNCGFVDRLCNGMSLEECKREAIRAARKEISENRNVQIIKAGK